MPAPKKSRAAAPAAKAGTPPKSDAVRIVAGSDEAEVKRRAAELAAQMASPDAGEFGRDVIDGAADNAEQAATRIHETGQALLTLPFFGGEKLVWLKSANFLADTVLGRSNAVTEALEHLQATLAAGLPAGVKFLFSAVDPDKRRSFYKALLKAGEVEVWISSTPPAAAGRNPRPRSSRARLRPAGCAPARPRWNCWRCSRAAIPARWKANLEKIDLYLGPGRRELPLTTCARWCR